MNEEIWKQVPEYEGAYEVSNLGRLKSLSRVSIKSNMRRCVVSEHIVNAYLTSDGYLRTGLSKNKVSKMMLVHRIVAITFLENKEGKRTVNHINGIKTDNRVENLEWATDIENVQHSWTHLGREGSLKGKFGELHHASQLISSTCIHTGEKTFYHGIREAGRMSGSSRSCIYKAMARGTGTKDGKIWKKEK